MRRAVYFWHVGPDPRPGHARSPQAEQRQRELQAIKKQVDELELKRATFQRKVDLIERLQAEQQGPVHMLDEISKALPDFVWLDRPGPDGQPSSGSRARATA